MERNPGLEVLDTTSLPGEPTSLPGVDPRCGSRASHNHNLNSSGLPAPMQDTLVCKVATEALTNGVNHSRAATKVTSSKDTTTITQHTTRANTRNNTLLLPLTKTLDKIPMLTSSRFSFLTFPSNHDYWDQSNAHFFPDRPPLPLPCSYDQLLSSSVEWCLDTAPTWYFFFRGLSECSQYGWYNLPLFEFWLTPQPYTNVFSLSTY